MNCLSFEAVTKFQLRPTLKIFGLQASSNYNRTSDDKNRLKQIKNYSKKFFIE